MTKLPDVDTSGNRWEVRLLGTAADLDYLARKFGSGAVRVKRGSRESGFVIEADVFATQKNSDAILEVANQLAEVLAGVIACEFGGAHRLTCDAAHLYEADGRRRSFMQLHDSVEVRAEIEAVVIRADGTTEVATTDPRRNRAAKILDLALRDSAINKAVRLLGRETPAWVSLYKVYELFEKEFGGQHRVQGLPWVTKADVRRFKLSANSAAASGDAARHAVDSGDPPKNPMSLEEAEGFVRRLLAKWFDEKGS